MAYWYSIEHVDKGTNDSIYYTIISVLCIIQAGSHVREDLVSGIVVMISEAEDLHGYSVQKLFLALRDDISQVSRCHSSICLSIYLSIYLLSFYLSIHLSIYLSIYFLATSLSSWSLVYWRIWWSVDHWTSWRRGTYSGSLW